MSGRDDVDDGRVDHGRVDDGQDAPTRTVTAAGADVGYREYGTPGGVPLVALNHLGANLDDWDLRVLGEVARDRHVIALEHRGVGASTGRVRDSIEGMAADVGAVVRALGHERVDLFGVSMGGMVALALVDRDPLLVDRLVLAGAGPAGGPGLTRLTRTMVPATLLAVLRRRDPRERLFFTRSATGTAAARRYLDQLAEQRRRRTSGTVPRVGAGVVRAQLAAVHRWAGQTPRRSSPFTGPVLVVHGDRDAMVPAANLAAITGLFPAATARLHPDAGHGVVSQDHREVVLDLREFLRRPAEPVHQNPQNPQNQEIQP